jgi:DNA polymerase-3 subunit alpha
MAEFTHLHLHSDRSALDAITRIPDLVKYCKELGMTSVAVTDHGVCSATISLYEECKKEGIKPIIGMEAYLAPTDDHTLREPIPDFPKQQCYHITTLAMNEAGVKQIYKLSSLGYTEGFYYKPRISLKLLREIGKDLIIMGACGKGPICWDLQNNQVDRAYKWARDFKESFGDRFYVELMDHGLDWQKSLNIQLRELCSTLNIPWVPTNDAHFLTREDHYAHSVMMCIQLKQKLSTLTMKYPEECYVKSPLEMEDLFGKPACLRTLEIAEKINIELNLKTLYFPNFLEISTENPPIIDL